MPRKSTITKKVRRRIVAARTGPIKTPWKVLEAEIGLCKTRMYKILKEEQRVTDKNVHERFTSGHENRTTV